MVYETREHDTAQKKKKRLESIHLFWSDTFKIIHAKYIDYMLRKEK